jgi:mannose-6-phosphate isomerase-like protein (cupin superfamily)
VPEIVVASLEETARIADALTAWEPTLGLSVYQNEPSFFDADATIYGIVLSDDSTLMVRHKPRNVKRGDAIVVPRGVSIDAEPGVTMFALTHEGVAPVHFRERFIQTWGMEHLPLRESNESVAIVVPGEAARYRLSYEVLDLTSAGAVLTATGLNIHLLVVVAGAPRLSVDDTSVIELTPDQLALVPSLVSYRLDGVGRIGRIVLETETAHESRKFNLAVERLENSDPEFRPDQGSVRH